MFDIVLNFFPFWSSRVVSISFLSHLVSILCLFQFVSFCTFFSHSSTFPACLAFDSMHADRRSADWGYVCLPVLYP